MKKRSPKLVYCNWEKDYLKELESNKAIIIKNSQTIDRKTMEGVDGSIFSPKFSVPLNQDSNLLYSIREYSCSCGESYGKFYEGKICPICDQEVVEYFGGDIMQFGWIRLSNVAKNGKYKIMHPSAYKMVTNIIGKTNLNKILRREFKLDLNGNLIENLEDRKTPASKYYNIGYLEFHKKFEKIIKYYGEIKNKQDAAKFIIEEFNKGKVFSFVIPVLNPLMRPATTSSQKREFRFSDLNESYMILISNAKILENKTNNLNELNIIEILNEMQHELENVFNIINKFKFSERSGFIRNSLISTRCSFSSRMVVIPYVNTQNFKINGIVISYKSFMRLHTFELINLLLKFNKLMTPHEAYSYLMNSFNSSKKDIYMIRLCRFLIDNAPKQFGGPRVLINRNPTFELGSTQCVRIIDIFENPNYTVMAIPLTSIKSMNADFDGDVLNLWSLKELSVINSFIKGFDPKNLLINFSGDGINDMFFPSKDQIATISSFVAPTDDHISNDDRSIKEIKIGALNELDAESFLRDANGDEIEAEAFMNINEDIENQFEINGDIELLKNESETSIDNIHFKEFEYELSKLKNIKIYDGYKKQLNIYSNKE